MATGRHRSDRKQTKKRLGLTPRTRSWGAIGGIALPVLWAPMMLIVPRLPDLGSPTRIEHFYATNQGALKVIIVLASAGFLPFLAFLAALLDRLWHDHAPRGLILIALGSALMFMTTLAVALGVAASAALISADGSSRLLSGLHTVAFPRRTRCPVGRRVLCHYRNPLSKRSPLPSWLGAVSVIGAVANLGALGGILSRTGPLNSCNGPLGGITAPLTAWTVWVLLAAIWLLKRPNPQITATLS